jgi:hypothetical protein
MLNICLKMRSFLMAEMLNSLLSSLVCFTGDTTCNILLSISDQYFVNLKCLISLLTFKFACGVACGVQWTRRVRMWTWDHMPLPLKTRTT